AQARGRRVAVRATTPDRLPLCGEWRPGLFVLTGMGSRGFCVAPLLGEHLAALAMERPSPLSAEAARRLDPRRWPPQPTPGVDVDGKGSTEAVI
ncbi:MAG TPA: FAD-dependent oxidoreductase, partial [Brevundimonas sp.]